METDVAAGGWISTCFLHYYRGMAVEENDNRPVRADRYSGKTFLRFKVRWQDGKEIWAGAVDGFELIYAVIGVVQ